MSAAAMVEELFQQGVRLWVEGEKLRYRGPREVLTPDVLAELKAVKPELVDAIQSELVESVGDVSDIARQCFTPEPFNPEEHPMPAAPRGEDPMVLRGTPKGRFFRRGEAWRSVGPEGFAVGGSARLGAPYHPMYQPGERRDAPAPTGAKRFSYLVTWPDAEKLPGRSKDLDEQTGGQRLKTTPSILFMASSNAEAWEVFEDIKRRQTGGKDKVMWLERLGVRGDTKVMRNRVLKAGGK